MNTRHGKQRGLEFNPDQYHQERMKLLLEERASLCEELRRLGVDPEQVLARTASDRNDSGNAPNTADCQHARQR